MTCIIGFTTGNEVYIGGDSAGTQDTDIRIRADEKVFKRDGMVFGFTSSYRMGQILRYSFQVPDHDPRKSDFEYLCTDFIDALMKCYKEKNFARLEDNVMEGGVFLLGYNGKLYQVEADFQVGEVVDSFDAVGCGSEYALGVLKATFDENISAEEYIENALYISAYFSGAVCEPFTVVNNFQE